METTKFCLITDGDCHWFICPVDKKQEAEDILQEIAAYWENSDYDKSCPKQPDYLVAIDSPREIFFDSYEIMLN